MRLQRKSHFHAFLDIVFMDLVTMWQFWALLGVQVPRGSQAFKIGSVTKFLQDLQELLPKH